MTDVGPGQSRVTRRTSALRAAGSPVPAAATTAATSAFSPVAAPVPAPAAAPVAAPVPAPAAAPAAAPAPAPAPAPGTPTPAAERIPASEPAEPDEAQVLVAQARSRCPGLCNFIMNLCSLISIFTKRATALSVVMALACVAVYSCTLPFVWAVLVILAICLVGDVMPGDQIRHPTEWFTSIYDAVLKSSAHASIIGHCSLVMVTISGVLFEVFTYSLERFSPHGFDGFLEIIGLAVSDRWMTIVMLIQPKNMVRVGLAVWCLTNLVALVQRGFRKLKHAARSAAPGIFEHVGAFLFVSLALLPEFDRTFWVKFGMLMILIRISFVLTRVTERSKTSAWILFTDFVVTLVMLLVSFFSSFATPWRIWVLTGLGIAISLSLLLIVYNVIRPRLLAFVGGVPTRPQQVAAFILLAAVLLVLTRYEAFQPAYSECPFALGQEAPFNHTGRSVAKLFVEMVNQNSQNGAEYATRPLHPRAFGCVKAEFRVNDMLPYALRHGVFNNLGATFPAWLRFSTSKPDQPDSAMDVRGLGIKLMNVPGPKVLNGTDDEQFTQDFMLISSKFFFTGDATHYRAVSKALIDPSYLRPYMLPILARIWLMAREGSYMVNPLDFTFFSATPYRLGFSTQAVKYRVQPCPTTLDPARAKRDAARMKNSPQAYLRRAMIDQLADTGACMEFAVQVQTDPCVDKIEDPTTEWAGVWVPLATITIPPQVFSSKAQDEFCANTAYSPWHTRPEHVPLGAINHQRLLAYKMSSERRRALNVKSRFSPPVSEPNGTEEFSQVDDITSAFDEGEGEPQLYQYAPYPAPYNNLPRHIRELPPSMVHSAHLTLRFNLPRMAYDAVYLGVCKLLKLVGFDLAKQELMINTMLEGLVNDIARDFVPFNWIRRFFGMREAIPVEDFKKPQDWANFVDYDPLIMSRFKLPEISQNWDRDHIFARQFMNGVNPMALFNVSVLGLPAPLAESLKDTANLERLYKVFQGKYTLEALKTAGRLYAAEYPLLDGLEAREDRYFYPSSILFWVDDNKALMPAAIQLTRGPGTHRVFFPENSKVWMFAKMHAMSSDAQYHEMVSHLAFTHLIMEPQVIGFYRQLNASHPIMRFMSPHFFQTIAINDFGRKTLLNPGSVFDRIMGCGLNGSLELMSRAYESYYNTTLLSPEVELTRRGFDITVTSSHVHDRLPGFYYRDDALRLWNLTKEYVGKVVHHNYQSDQEVLEDAQIQMLWRELKHPDFGDVKGMPELTTVDALIEYLSCLLFTATGGHSAVNFGQYDFYAFAPNRPLSLHQPMPHDLTMVDDAYICSALARKDEMSWIIRIASVLSLPADYVLSTGFAPGQKLLDDRDDDATRAAHEEFRQKLERMEHDIDKRNNDNKQHPHPSLGGEYPYLKPSRIGDSISI